MDRKEKESLRLLFEMIRNSRRSDRELAKSLGVSQPTVSRKRAILEKEGYIKEYTLVPNFVKLGYDFLAVTFLSFAEDRPELFDKAREWTKAQPSVLFAADGGGLGMNSIMVSVHKTYGDYSMLLTKLRQDWQPNLRQIETFIVSLGQTQRFIKDFSFRPLEKNE
ncbi:Lrp/AsnC family transcriptional regulator [Candidatus Bathyarchaeota archaeon]|nr:Lrp/AsnC family transcriptional regulator [Candidatus Bathyarchaeota archaeon]